MKKKILKVYNTFYILLINLLIFIENQSQSSLSVPDFFSKKRLSKRPSTDSLNEDFNEREFKEKLLYFLIENNISFSVIESKPFRDLLLYC